MTPSSLPTGPHPDLLEGLTHPTDVAGLSLADKEALAAELRHRLIHTVAANGGHLAPSLGVVELTLALLSVFNPQHDRLIWDVGHQCYAWKLLTGRADRFPTLRTHGGLSGFPKPEESPFDHFGVGHSSTSVSAALGMALARDLDPDPVRRASHVLAIIGDGSLTGGMAFEGLNQAGAMGRRLIVVLNDNEMSISRNVGALSLFLSRNMERGWARRLRREVKDWLKSIPGIGEEMANYAHRSHRSLKNVFTPGMLFEAFRFNYIGPVNGHDITELENHLRMAASIDDQPVLLHVLTRKGKGYPPAEADPARFHGLGRFDVDSGKPHASAPGTPPSYTEVFGRTLCELADRDPRVVAITAAMSSGTGTNEFRHRFPTRFVDVGICEQHAVTFAAGLASQGYRPFVAVYSTFAQRAYDQVVHDVCIQNLPVTLCLDRAGLVGEDGPTHHGAFDLSFLRHIPNLSILAPRDEAELRRALLAALEGNGPLVIRYPRGAATGMSLSETIEPLPATGELLREGTQALIIGVGSLVLPALQAAQDLAASPAPSHTAADPAQPHAVAGSDHPLAAADPAQPHIDAGSSHPLAGTGPDVAVFDARWIKPLPLEQLLALRRRFDRMLVVEENALAGGFGSAILEAFAEANLLDGLTLHRVGLPDRFVEHGAQSLLRRELGFDAQGIRQALENLLK